MLSSYLPQKQIRAALIGMMTTRCSRRRLQIQHRSYSSTTFLRDRIVIAVGGNALQRRGERLTIENMLKAAAEMAPTIAAMSKEHQLVLTHGNGPQVGELALERSAATFDVLGAESVGQIGYVLAQALASVGTNSVPIVTQGANCGSPADISFTIKPKND